MSDFNHLSPSNLEELELVVALLRSDYLLRGLCPWLVDEYLAALEFVLALDHEQER